MPRAPVPDVRFDFRGGVNTAFGVDLVDATELRAMQNARSYPLGSVSKRPGSKRIHATSLGNVVNGLFQYHPAIGRQIVAIADGYLWKKLPGAADFTRVGTQVFSSSAIRYHPYRSGSNIYLYLADGTDVWRWSGSALTNGFSNAPNATWLSLYKERMFALDGTKRLYWSDIGDPEEWDVADGAGFADVETYDAEPLVGSVVVGSSLLLCKEDSIARFTGVDNNEILIARDTEGVSAEMGLIAPNTLIRFEECAFLMTQKGPYIATESGIQEISLKVADQFDFANKELWRDSWAVLNSDAREVLLMMPGNGDTDLSTGWLLNLRTRSWTGPYRFPFATATLAHYEREDGSDAFMIGGDDGFVRDGCIGVLDDVLSDGTGGEDVELELEFPPLLFQDPTRVKSLAEVNVQANLGASGSMVLAWESELGSGSVTVASRGAAMLDYPIRLLAKGKRLTVTLTEASGNAVEIAGVLFKAFLEGRR